MVVERDYEIMKSDSREVLIRMADDVKEGDIVEIEIESAFDFGPLIGYYANEGIHCCKGMVRNFNMDLENGLIGSFFVRDYRIVGKSRHF